MQINLISVEKELRMAVAPDPSGWISGYAHVGKEAPAGIRTAVSWKSQFVDLCLEALGWGSLPRSD